MSAMTGFSKATSYKGSMKWQDHCGNWRLAEYTVNQNTDTIKIYWIDSEDYKEMHLIMETTTQFLIPVAKYLLPEIERIRKEIL